MIVPSSGRDAVGSAARRRAFHFAGGVPLLLAMAAVNLSDVGWGAEPSTSEPSIEARVQALIPDLEAYIASGMKAFDSPGLAIGIVADDRLVYGKGFGVRGKAGGAPVDTGTVFQIGSTTKAFL